MTSEAVVTDQSVEPTVPKGNTVSPGNTELSDAMDAVNLERALIDFEIANARVIDLTARLTGFSQDLLATRSELGLARLRIAQLEIESAELAVVKSSAAYKALRVLGDSRAKLMRR